jgi:hypothetical protein
MGVEVGAANVDVSFLAAQADLNTVLVVAVFTVPTFVQLLCHDDLA